MESLNDIQMKAIRQLLSKPTESLVPREENDVIFQMPQRFYNKKYRNNLNEINEALDVEHSTVVSVKNTTVPEKEVTAASEIDKGFSVFIPKHMDAAAKLIKKFIGAPTVDDLISIAAYTRERVNPLLFTYAFTTALLHRPDTKGVEMPNFATTFPGRFMDASVFTEARRSANIAPPEEREPIIIRKNFTATDREPEQTMAYFREDLGINLHHWHWHLVYPARGGVNLVKKDRRGELFYYMHEQVLARYNTERLCNNMEFVKPLDNLSESIPEGYFPKLNQMNSNRAWPPRFGNILLSNIERPTERLFLSIETVEQWMDIIKTAVRKGEIIHSNGRTIKLDVVKGIDLLGDLVEATDLSINRQLYGNLHNLGHVLIAFCHDPGERFLEGFSIMGDTSTAMRDPIFYRWHAAINDIFVSHKMNLQPYTNDELGFKNIQIQNINVQVTGRPINEINTFWERSVIDISRGLDFFPKGALPISVAHLQHGEFTYTVNVNNTSSKEVKGTLRIFMCPKYNLQNKMFMFNIMRQLMIEMDKVVVSLKPGANTITRKSVDSSVTIEYDKTFKSINTAKMSTKDFNQKNFCGCGWPDHMLVPKGTVEGFPMILFAMISDYTVDRVDQVIGNICIGADSYCGVFNNLYPDKRSMGYPFDRPGDPQVTNLSQFLTPNMKAVDILIKHKNETIPRPTPPVVKPTVLKVNT